MSWISRRSVPPFLVCPSFSIYTRTAAMCFGTRFLLRAHPQVNPITLCQGEEKQCFFFAFTPVVSLLEKRTNCMQKTYMIVSSLSHVWNYGDTHSFPLDCLGPIFFSSYSLNFINHPLLCHFQGFRVSVAVLFCNFT